MEIYYILLETEILESEEVQNKPLPKTEMTISTSHNGIKQHAYS